jgi:biotin operon repressor
MPVEPDPPSPPLALEDRVALLKALADASRLQVVSALLDRPHCAEELAERLGRAPSTVSFHLRKLDEAGLVTKTKTQYYLVYALRDDLLRLTLRELLSLPAARDRAEVRRVERSRTKVLRAFFRKGELVQLPKQWRKRRIVLEPFLDLFEVGRRYREREVDERIHTLYADHCTLRRLLVDEGLMARDGDVYQRIDPNPSPPAAAATTGASTMESRKEMKRQFTEAPKEAGVFQIRNTVDGKVLLGSSTNLHGPFNKHRFMLTHRMHDNRKLQADWDRLGPDAFAFEVLEVVEAKDDPGFSLTDELTLLEQIWLEKLQPLAPRGYNTNARIRE